MQKHDLGLASEAIIQCGSATKKERPTASNHPTLSINEKLAAEQRWPIAWDASQEQPPKRNRVAEQRWPPSLGSQPRNPIKASVDTGAPFFNEKVLAKIRFG